MWERPDGSEYDFSHFYLDNSNDTAGNGGVDESFVIGAAVFDVHDPVALPTDVDVEIVRLHFSVLPGGLDTGTHIRFEDGGQGTGEPDENSVNVNYETVLPELAASFVLIDCQVVFNVVPDIATFVRGDTNGDGAVDLSDAIATLGALFLAEPEIPCEDAGDFNDDGKVDISDAIATLGVLFLGQGSVPLPGMKECGVDPTEDELNCLSYRSCP